jgi:hypothetical protein
MEIQFADLFADINLNKKSVIHSMCDILDEKVVALSLSVRERCKQHHKSCSTSSFLVNNDNRVTLRLSESAGGNSRPAQAADCARPANSDRLQMDGQQFFLPSSCTAGWAQ